MGIVRNQSFKNTLTTYLGFGIGAINILFLYTNFLTDEYHGLVAFVLSTANIMMPLFALGTHNTLIKYYSSFKTRNNINSFLTLMLLMPLCIIVPIGLIGLLAFESITDLLSAKNAIIKDYVWMIFVAAICFSYFEIFYSWAKVQMQSVFGNFMKEVFHRVGILMLFGLIYLDYVNVQQFIYGVILIYIIRLVVMMVYAFGVKRPVFRLGKIPNLLSIIKYSLLIIIAGSVATIILEIDKFMIGELLIIENVAYYGVAIYIATVIGVPARSMYQITNPITAKLLNEKDHDGLERLYKKSSLNLFIISGLIFLLIILNINQLYEVIPEKFGGALLVVFLVSIAKLTDNIIGNNNAILFNSKHYKAVLILGVLLALTAIGLNLWFIPLYGVNGAAFATVISIFAYNASKLIFVYVKFKISPFTSNTVKTFLLILVLILVFYFWEFPFHPLINIALKSILITFCYALIVYSLNFSEDISKILDKVFRN
ncbi:MAG: polysaccharide biosynthesis C-terminal domain-containing protein [Bacteroidia bacterium]|nr:polysaccharide biosynthesis C-terminal domain-containing protein [Bacteroidia bacterium]MBT8277955.1 polysaccharide biosynthesis C-terminal domain-containing protein [Bacteroidia bacterium]NND24514.1 oligosaccharide flippase family protein [Flavobacteriaceae bacterium]NNK60181.1 oligosaccharide flippase family protein [Flavobacteriaceae bacterium]NNL31647.1 oligosaccharide flippase family protein [Flavobacteriaceae bacterium]